MSDPVNTLYSLLVELPDIAREKRQPKKEFMTPCTALSSFGRTMPVAMTTSCPKNHIPLNTKSSYHMKELMWTFGVDHTIGNNHRKYI